MPKPLRAGFIELRVTGRDTSLPLASTDCVRDYALSSVLKYRRSHMFVMLRKVIF
jgi:hypothetical protein